MYKGEKIELALIDGIKPTFFQPRSIPLVLKSKIKAELTRLKKYDVINKIKYRLWNTSIVPIIKPSVDIRICGGYKIIVKPF